MGKINLLSEEVANLIAAGEVVDRPASVLKELLENAIDAGATAITCEISRGGVGLLRVSDNGCGIASDDLPLALQRHATSKIKNAEDLDAIFTLGFRGEALAAIAGVSVMEIVTRTKDAPQGTMLLAEYGKITEVSEIGCREGTTVVVRELFGNVPARRKFLKKDMTEAAAATAYAEKVALSHPEVAITLLLDGNVKFETAGDGNLLGVIYALEGREYSKKMLPVKGDYAGMAVTGYVGRSDCVAGSRNRQNFFINGRYIRSKTMQAALEQAFTSYIAPGKFPAAFLFLSISPGAVDVNVHPAKLEVRFSDERPVFEIVYHAVRGTLEDAAYRPELSEVTVKRGSVPPHTPLTMSLPTRAPAPVTVKPHRELTPAASLRILADHAAENERADDARVAEGAGLIYPSKEKEKPTAAVTPPPAKAPEAPLSSTVPAQASPTLAAPQEPTAAAPSVPPYHLVGEAFDTYLILEIKDRLLVIDKHAAHERILFEELLREQRASGAAASQGLLLPLSPTLTATEQAAALEYRADLEAAGFLFTAGKESVRIEAIPARVAPDAAAALFTEMVASLAEGAGSPALSEASRREKTLWQVACKAAIKGGRHYDEAHVAWLCEQVLSMPDITVCPHGRPIAFEMTKYWLDREFNRIQH